MSNSTSFQTHYGYEKGMLHNHENNHQASSSQKHVHRSKRTGHNRTTKAQKKRAFIANTLFSILCLIAIVIVAIIAYDRWVGLF